MRWYKKANIRRLLKNSKVQIVEFLRFLYLWISKFIFDILIGSFFALVVLFFVTRKMPSTFIDNRVISSITDKYRDGYIYKVLTTQIKPETNPSIIIWGNDKDINESCTKFLDLDKEPFLDIYKKNDFSLLSLIPFFKQEYKLYTSFNLKFLEKLIDKKNDYWITNVKVVDLDGDGSDEIVVKAYTLLCGSGGQAYQFILRDNGSGLDILETFPEIGIEDKKNKEPKWLIQNEQVSYGNNLRNIVTTHSDTYWEYRDLDDDKLDELIMAFPDYSGEEWGGNSCHICPHAWLIGVYKFNGKQFIIDNSWNNGLLYITPKKLDFKEVHGYPNLESNIVVMLFPYYFDCEECGTFYNGTRIKSEILRIVEEKYGKFDSKMY